MVISARTRWTLGICLVLLVAGVPTLYYRWQYTYAKRLREVTPGLFYRSGQLTVAGFQEAVERLHLRTIVNLQDEYPDPKIDTGYLGLSSIRESAMCERLGVHYVYIVPDLVPRRQVPEHHPAAIDQFLALLDDPANFPMLIHCRAGLHRTGVMTAVYRMEHDGWTPRQAIDEIKRNGFGDFACTSANDYIKQYVLTYKPRTAQAE